MGALKSKTMWFAALVALSGLVEQNTGLLRDSLGADNFGLLMAGIGLVTAILRKVTKEPLDWK